MDIQILLIKFCDHYTYIKGYSPETIRRYKQVVKAYCNFFSITQLEEVTEESIKRLFYYGRTEREWSANTFICYHKTLMMFLRWCVEEGYRKDNPVEKNEVPKLEKRIPPKLTK